MTLPELVLDVLHENSGGIKYLDLFVRILEALRDGEIVDDDFPTIEGNRTSLETKRIDGIFEKKLAKIPKVSILTYAWKMDEDTYREKKFVYTVMPKEKT